MLCSAKYAGEDSLQLAVLGVHELLVYSPESRSVTAKYLFPITLHDTVLLTNSSNGSEEITTQVYVHLKVIITAVYKKWWNKH